MRRRRLPAEWEEQDGILLAWPHEGTDWLPHLDAVEPVFAEIAAQISRFERVLIVAPESAAVGTRLRDAGARTDRISIWDVPTNDTWARDFGPITVEEEGRCLLLDFGFNGWGLKYAADLDNRVTRRLWARGALGAADLRAVGLVLEGGSIESDGFGTILTTSRCLLEPNRNPQLNRMELESIFGEQLGAERLLWLEHGHLIGDDTDSHVDTLARFCPGDGILHVVCDDEADEHFESIGAMIDQLTRLRTSKGGPYRLIPLPWPSPAHDELGGRLPVTYANFLIVNGAVLVPTYRQERDGQALAAVAQAFPGRTVVGVDCLPLLVQRGSLHCVTMQLPRGVLS